MDTLIVVDPAHEYGEYVINASDYDPDKHMIKGEELYEAEVEVAEAEVEEEGEGKKKSKQKTGAKPPAVDD